jgi:PST family polysaccharide transporter
VLNQSVVFFITILFLLKTSWFKMKYFIKGIDKKSLNNLAKFSLMAIVTAIVTPTSHLIIRNYIGENISWDAAGYWQGIWYISTMYLLFITTVLSVYYTPKLSELKTNIELKKEIINGYMKILPVAIILALGIYIFKDLAIKVAFSDKFSPMMELFKWQLIGDIIKIASFLLSTMMIAKAMTKVYIYSEIFFSILFMIQSIIWIKYFGLIGITYAFALNYLLYFIFMLYNFKGVLNAK